MHPRDAERCEGGNRGGVFLRCAMDNHLPSLITLLLCLENVPGSSVVVQWPPRVRAPSGGNVTLPCELRPADHRFEVIYTYWSVGGGRREEHIIFPDSRDSEYWGRVSLVDGKSGLDLSLRIQRLRPNDSNIYHCLASTYVQGNHISLWGKGTRLIVSAPDPPKDLLALYILLLLMTFVLLVFGAWYWITKSRAEHNH
uniref:poliovirus receptor homolog isoform X1 n=2 Tax=Pristiophorus japonicus TaxID=55135 RepID=UPI00398F69E0